MAQDIFQKFIDDTLAAAGFAEAPEDFKTSYRERMELMFAKRLGVDCLAMLDKEDMVAFKELAEKQPPASPQTIFQFFQKHIPSFEKKIVEIMREFQAEFVQAAKAVKV